MGRIKIKDLPRDVEISEEEMKRMRGGGLLSSPLVHYVGKTCAYLSYQPITYGFKCEIGPMSWDPGDIGF